MADGVRETTPHPIQGLIAIAKHEKELVVGGYEAEGGRLFQKSNLQGTGREQWADGRTKWSSGWAVEFRVSSTCDGSYQGR